MGGTHVRYNIESISLIIITIMIFRDILYNEADERIGAPLGAEKEKKNKKSRKPPFMFYVCHVI